MRGRHLWKVCGKPLRALVFTCFKMRLATSACRAAIRPCAVTGIVLVGGGVLEVAEASPPSAAAARRAAFSARRSALAKTKRRVRRCM